MEVLKSISPKSKGGPYVSCIISPLPRLRSPGSLLQQDCLPAMLCFQTLSWLASLQHPALTLNSSRPSLTIQPKVASVHCSTHISMSHCIYYHLIFYCLSLVCLSPLVHKLHWAETPSALSVQGPLLLAHSRSSMKCLLSESMVLSLIGEKNGRHVQVKNIHIGEEGAEETAHLTYLLPFSQKKMQ